MTATIRSLLLEGLGSMIVTANFLLLLTVWPIGLVTAPVSLLLWWYFVMVVGSSPAKKISIRRRIPLPASPIPLVDLTPSP